MAQQIDRRVNLTLRTAKVTNLNYQPERAGEELQPRVDLSLEFLLQRDDMDELINTVSNPLMVLWHKEGRPQLKDVDWIPLTCKATGKARLGNAAAEEDAVLTFDPAVLKKLKIRPVLGHNAEVQCQLRMDPGELLDELGHIRLAETCSFAFVGESEAAPKKPEDDQNEMDV